jgi:hypothetical protein
MYPSANESDENFLTSDLNLSSLDQDNNVPNLTIESSGYPSLFHQQQQKFQFQENRPRSSNLTNPIQHKLDDSPNDELINHQSGFRRNSQNIVSFNNNNHNQLLNANNINDQSNVRKKLQERLQRNTAATSNTISISNSGSGTSFVGSSIVANNSLQHQSHTNSNVAVVSPVVSSHNQSTNFQQDNLTNKKPILNEVPLYPTQASSAAQIQQQKIFNANKFIGSPNLMTPQQQQHLATTTTTVTVTTQHYPVSDQTLSIPAIPSTSLQAQISMHSLSPNSIMNQNQIYPVNPPPYNGQISQKNYLSQQPVAINNSTNYNFSNQQSSPISQNQHYEMNNSSNYYLPQNSSISPSLMSHHNNQNSKLEPDQSLRKQRSIESSKKHSNKRLHANNLKPDIYSSNSMYTSDIYSISPIASPSSPLGNANTVGNNSNQIQKSIPYVNHHPSHSHPLPFTGGDGLIHASNMQPSNQINGMNQNSYQYSDYYNNTNNNNGSPISNQNSYAMPPYHKPNGALNFNYMNQPKYSNVNPIPPHQHQQNQQHQQVTFNRPMSNLPPPQSQQRPLPPPPPPPPQLNLNNDNSDQFILDDVLDLNFTTNDSLISSSTPNAPTSTTLLEDDSFLNIPYNQANNNNNNIVSQSQIVRPSNNSNPNYFQQQQQPQYQNQIINNNSASSTNMTHYSQQHQIYYNPQHQLQQQFTQSSIYQQQNQQNINNQFKAPNNTQYTNNSSFDIIVEDSKGGLLQQLLLD